MSNSIFKLVKHRIKLLVMPITKLFTFAFPKNKKLILFSAWFGQKYNDSPKYLFDYLLENSEYKVVWQTANKALFRDMKEKGLPVVFRNSLSGLFCQLRAKMYVSSVEFADFNRYLMANCILFDIDHGFPIKQSGHEIPTLDKQYLQMETAMRRKVKLYKTASSRFVKDTVCRYSNTRPEDVVFCNKPRTDVFFDSNLRSGVNTCVDELKKGYKAIVYMPTHRSEGQIRLDINSIFNLKNLQQFCEEHDCVFLIKKHFYHRNEEEDLSSYSRIFDITKEDIEPQTLLFQADVLISDYSAAYIDYLLLDRPILFYTFDYQSFTKFERSLYLKFEDNHSGFRVFNFEDLIAKLSIVCSDWKDDEHSLGRREIKDMYFDSRLKLGHCREEIKTIIDALMQGNYKPEWRD